MTDDPLKSARDAVFCKLGRNIALFQQLEQLLKRLIVHSQFGGSTPDELESSLAKRRAIVAKRPFGDLIQLFKDDVLGAKVTTPASPMDGNGPVRIRMTFQIEGVEYLQKKEADFAALLAERNRLVHHLLEDHDLLKAEGIQGLDDLLDPQAERIRNGLKELRSIAGQWNEAMQEIRQLDPEAIIAQIGSFPPED